MEQNNYSVFYIALPLSHLLELTTQDQSCLQLPFGPSPSEVSVKVKYPFAAQKRDERNKYIMYNCTQRKMGNWTCTPPC